MATIYNTHKKHRHACLYSNTAWYYKKNKNTYM